MLFLTLSLNQVRYFFKTIPPVYELFYQLPYYIYALVLLLPYIQNRELFKQLLETHFRESITTIWCCVNSQQCQNHEDSSDFCVTTGAGGCITIFDRLCKHPPQASVKSGVVGILRQQQLYSGSMESPNDHWPSPSSWVPPAACSSCSSAGGLHQWLHSAMEYSAARDNQSKSSRKSWWWHETYRTPLSLDPAKRTLIIN